MKSVIIRIIIMSVLLCLAVGACKKKETEKEYMTGSVNIEYDMPHYVMPGERYVFKASGITKPDGYDVYYYFSNPATNTKDTLRTAADSYVFDVPDTLGTFSLSCIAYANGGTDKYYTSSNYIYFVIVSDDPEHGSISLAEPWPFEEQVMLYDRNYYVVTAGGKEWLRSNLCYVRRESGEESFGHSYQGSPAMQNIFGGFYTWEEAQTACPDGWHLPSEAEWTALLKQAGAPDDLQPMQTSPVGAGKLMVKATFNGETLWDFYRGVTITDESISAMPFGYATLKGGSFEFQGYTSYAVFWTADEFEGLGVYRYIYKEYDCVYAGTADKRTFAANVRCVR